MLRTSFCVLLALHGAVHVLGFAKAFGLAELPQLKQPIGHTLGLLWLAAAIGFTASALLFAIAPRYWWMAAAPTLALSTTLIISSWKDASVGLIPNVIVAIPLALALLDLRSSSFRSIYEREAERLSIANAPSRPVTDAELARLPSAVQRYLRRVGVVGKPHVTDFRAHFTGVLRGAADAAWMPTTAEQHDFFDRPARLFLARARRQGIPFEVLHVYEGAAAWMRVRILSSFEVLHIQGPEMTQSETVTLFNDMCLLAPATLVDANVQWQEVDANRVHATFTNAGRTISAVLSFDAQGDLVNFVSHDRYQLDGKSKRRLPWITPVSAYRDFGGVRLGSRGEAAWQEPEGTWTYARFELKTIEYNVGPAGVRRSSQSIRAATAWNSAIERPSILGF